MRYCLLCVAARCNVLFVCCEVLMFVVRCRWRCCMLFDVCCHLLWLAIAVRCLLLAVLRLVVAVVGCGLLLLLQCVAY